MTQFPKSKMTKEVWNYLDSRGKINTINWFINSKYRISKRLTSWLKEQVIIPEKELELCDEIMINILRETRKEIIYKSDNNIWQMSEYWQTYKETNELKTGDCEDGAIYMYIKARQSGVPANRLLLMCGDVINPSTKSLTGHCWLAYRSDGNPFGFEFLDWCYYYNANNIGDRPRYNVNKQEIQDYNRKYFKLWFAFNEEKSHSEIIYNEVL
ncbi:MAG TPA: hypothetical protein V6C58_25540 [Allocoleopsis sp.]